jgi:hypothetical protein
MGNLLPQKPPKVECRCFCICTTAKFKLPFAKAKQVQKSNQNDHGSHHTTCPPPPVPAMALAMNDISGLPLPPAWSPSSRNSSSSGTRNAPCAHTTPRASAEKMSDPTEVRNTTHAGACDQAPEHLLVREGASEGGDRRRVGGAEHVQEAPGGEQREERRQRERMREERRAQGERHHRGVVHAEVGQVLAQAGGGVGQGVRAGERRAVHERAPDSARRP